MTYAARLRLERPLGAAASDRGLAVARQLVDADTGAPVTRARLGQAIKVQLTVTAAGRQAYVAVVDHLPAGLEPIITRFAADRAGRTTTAGRGPGALVVQLADALAAPRAARRSRARVRRRARRRGLDATSTWSARPRVGTFALPPATAEAMYEPAINGRSAAATLVMER